MSKRIALLSAVAFGALALTATIAAPVSAQEKTVMVGGAAMFPSKNIIQNAVNSKDHTTLVAAVKAAGLVETLEGKGPFTVFAPTNAAFGKLPAGTVDTLVKPESKATLTVSEQQAAATTAAKTIQPAWVRVLHWVNAFAMVLMIMSGWQIYNASPLFDFRFSSSITLGGWLGGALLWHFAAMWILMVNGLVYLALGLATGRFRKKLLPITPAGLVSDAKAALTGKLSHADLSTYNYVQKLL